MITPRLTTRVALHAAVSAVCCRLLGLFRNRGFLQWFHLHSGLDDQVLQLSDIYVS